MDYADIKIGDVARLEKVFEREDLLKFADLSLDRNPIHLDEEYGKESMFKGNIVYGMLVASLISGVLAEKMPGYGTIYMSQELTFKRPVYLGEKCVASVKILEKRDEHNIIILGTRVCVDDEIVLDGEAVVKKP